MSPQVRTYVALLGVGLVVVAVTAFLTGKPLQGAGSHKYDYLFDWRFYVAVAGVLLLASASRTRRDWG